MSANVSLFEARGLGNMPTARITESQAISIESTIRKTLVIFHPMIREMRERAIYLGLLRGPQLSHREAAGVRTFIAPSSLYADLIMDKMQRKSN